MAGELTMANDMLQETERAAKQLLELIQEFAKIAVQSCRTKGQREEAKQVFDACYKQADMPIVEMDKDVYRAFAAQMRSDRLPFFPFEYRQGDMDDKKGPNRENIKLVFVRPEDREKAEIALRTAEEMKKIEYHKEPRTFLVNNLGKNVIDIPVRDNDEIWKMRFHDNATINKLPYTIRVNADGKEVITVSYGDKEKLNRSIFATEYDLNGKAADTYRTVASARTKQEQYDKERIGKIDSLGAVFIVKESPIGERLLLESGKFTRFDEKGNVVESMERDESPATFDYRRDNLITSFTRYGHAVIEKEDFDNALQQDIENDRHDKKGNLKCPEAEKLITISLKEYKPGLTKEEVQERMLSEACRDEFMKDKDFRKTAVISDHEFAIGKDAMLSAIELQDRAYSAAKENAIRSGNTDMLNAINEKYTAPNYGVLDAVQEKMISVEYNTETQMITMSDIISLSPEEIVLAQDAMEERIAASAKEIEEIEAEIEPDELDKGAEKGPEPEIMPDEEPVIDMEDLGEPEIEDVEKF